MRWRKVRLGEILQRKRTCAKVHAGETYKLVTVRLYHKGVVLRNVAQGSHIKSPMASIKAGDFILSGIDARNGAFGIVPEELEGALVTNDFWCLEANEELLSKEFLLFLSRSEFFTFICNQSSDGTTQRIRLQKDKFFNWEIHLPPVDEQVKLTRRLVDLENDSQRLTAELNYQLALLKKLRQSLLQDAVQGALVAQDTGDEPAAVLLQKIKAEKEALIAAKKLKKDKPLPLIKEEEIPFAIPEGWVWCRFIEIAIINPRNKVDDDLEVGFIPMPLVSQKFGFPPDYYVKKWGKVKSGFTHFANGDLVVAKITPCFENSKAGIISSLPNGIGAGTTELVVVRPFEGINVRFLYIIIKTERFLKKGQSIMRGVAGQQRIPPDYLADFLFALPPLPEQHRIVQKLESLMAACDALEQSIMQSRKQAAALLQVALREALQPTKQKEYNGEAVL